MNKFLSEAYPNKLDLIKLTSMEIEDQISNYTLTFIQVRRNDVEWGMKFPMFVISFYSFLIQKGNMPSQDDFWEHYLAENSRWFDSAGLTSEQKEGLKARVFRTYPSLVRDIHFCLLLKEGNLFAVVLYNEKLDIENGIDLIVEKNGRFFAVNLFTDTRRAYMGRTKKHHRHEKLGDLYYIDLPVQFKGSKQCGDFFLYGEREREELLKRVNGA
ncbi:MAG: TaqI family restriction endonuclease [PVC group bacterium]|nr:TaqI family restriction endonuclease [PVC group bacterium]